MACYSLKLTGHICLISPSGAIYLFVIQVLLAYICTISHASVGFWDNRIDPEDIMWRSAHWASGEWGSHKRMWIPIEAACSFSYYYYYYYYTQVVYLKDILCDLSLLLYSTIRYANDAHHTVQFTIRLTKMSVGQEKKQRNAYQILCHLNRLT